MSTDAKMRQQPRPPLVQITACRLLGFLCQLGYAEQTRDYYRRLYVMKRIAISEACQLFSVKVINYIQWQLRLEF